MYAKIMSAAPSGVNAVSVTAEVYIASGLPVFSIVGLPDAAVKESKDRVIAAIKNSGFDFSSRKVTVNLAPADIKKEGASFDLPIAIGILAAQQKISFNEVKNVCLLGELALDGTLRPVRGVLPIALDLKKLGFAAVLVPLENAKEASFARNITVYAAGTLKEAVETLTGQKQTKPYTFQESDLEEEVSSDGLDFSDIKGQAFAKRALEIAAAGGHNIVMIGPPGSGKTMLARRLPSILPPLSIDEALETAKVHSIAGLLVNRSGVTKKRPFRAPHHTVSDIALVGGGTNARPGEVSLAHNGLLFLDELTEFHRDALEVLRQPLEDKTVTVARAKGSYTYPASFMLVAAMNPCPCGNLGHPEVACRCTPYQILKYRAKISGPLLDRIDLHVEVPALRFSELADQKIKSEPSSNVKERVVRSRQKQIDRFSGNGIYSNAQMNTKQVKTYCALDQAGQKLLQGAVERFGLSARSYDRVIKVARTIADLAGSENIAAAHIAEAVQYRCLDRQT